LKVRMTSKKMFPLMAILLFIATACSTSQKVRWSTEHLAVKSAYVQKYVPGQENDKVISYLFIDIEFIDSSIVLEQALYNAHAVPISKVRLPLKINWADGEVVQSEKLEANQAIIYYAKGTKNYKQLVEGIQTKEDLHLPITESE